MPLPGLSDTDIAYIQRLDQIRAQVNNPVNIQTASNLSSLAGAYPGISPGLAYALAHAGVGPGQQAQAAWQAELSQNLASNKAQQAQGQPLSAKDDAAARRSQVLRQMADSGSGGLLGIGNLPGNLASHLPSAVRPGVESLTSTGPDPLGYKGSPLETNVVKPVTREIGGIAQGGLEGIQGAARQNFGIQGLPFLPEGASIDGRQVLANSNNPNAFGASDNPLQPIANTIQQTSVYQQVANGKTLGDGYLPSWDSSAMKAQADEARKFSPFLIGGSAWTPGRGVANLVFTPDSIPFKLASGGVDATIALSRLDPANAVLASLAEARAARRTFDVATGAPGLVSAANLAGEAVPETANLGSQLVTHALGMAGTPEPSASTRAWDALLQSDRTKFLEEVARVHGDDVANSVRNSLDAFEHPATFAHPDQAQLAAGGAVDGGLSPAFSQRNFQTWTQTPEAQDFYQKVADNHEAFDIHHALTDHNNHPLPYGFPSDQGTIPIVAQLRDTNTPEEVAALYGKYAGTYIQSTPPSVFNPAPPSRAFTPTPPPFLPANPDMNLLAEAGDQHLVNAGASIAERRAFANKAADAMDPASTISALELHADIMRAQLIHGGFTPERATEMTTYWKKDAEAMSIYMTDFEGRPITTPGMVQVEGVYQPVDSHVMLPSQINTPATTFPNFREVRNQMSPFSAYFASDAHAKVAHVADALNQTWKNLAVARASLGVKIVGDLQLKMAATGLNSIYGPGLPTHAISWIIGTPDNTWIDKLPEWERQMAVSAKASIGTGQTDITGGSFLTDAMYQDVKMNRYNELRNSQPGAKIYLDHFSMQNLNQPKGAEFLGQELARLREDNLIRGLIDQPSVASAKAWFWNDPQGAAIRNYMARDPALAQLATSRDLADAHVDAVLRGLDAITAHGNPAITDILRTGMVGDSPLMKDGEIPQAAIDTLRDHIADPNIEFPNQIRAREYAVLTPDQQKNRVAGFSWLTDKAFEYLLSRPTDFMGYGPAFRQSYFALAEALMPELSAADQAEFVANAEKANLPALTINRMSAVPANPDPRLTLASADMLAKAQGLDDVKALMHDLSSRDQLFDVLRLVAPFGEAWKQMLTKWLQVIADHPNALERGRQAWMGATSPGSSVIGQAFGGTPTNDGFFHKDQYGNMTFSIPGSEFLTDKLFGVPVPLAGEVKGLSMLGSGLPGVGPAISIPASYLVSQRPSSDELRKLILPVGLANSNPLRALTDAFTPSWFKRALGVMDSPSNTKAFGMTVKQVMVYLESTGDYKLQGDNARAEMSRLVKDATSKARWIQGISTLGSFAIPSNPSPEWLTKSNGSQLLLTWRAAKAYRDDLTANNGDANKALQSFMNTFGVDNFLVPQGQTRSNIPGGSRVTSSAGSAWRKQNLDLAAKYPNTYALFAPDSKDFDNNAYQDAIARGETKLLTPNEMLEAANSRLAHIAYGNLRDQLSADGKLDAADQAVLRDGSRTIMHKFPGFDPQKSTSTSTPVLMDELSRAVTDPKIARTPAGRAAQQYLGYRQQVLDYQRAVGMADTSISSSAKIAPLRAWLEQWGEYLAGQKPSFNPVWTGVLSREVGAASTTAATNALTTKAA